MSRGLSSAVFQLQTTAVSGDGGSEMGCWRRDEGHISSLTGFRAFLIIVVVRLSPVVLMFDDHALMQGKTLSALFT